MERYYFIIYYWPIHYDFFQGCLETKGQLKPFINIGLKESIFRAVELLTKYRIHRLPVMDEKTGDCAYILTHRRILHYIWKHVWILFSCVFFIFKRIWFQCALLPKPECLSQRVVDLEIGSWKNLIFVSRWLFWNTKTSKNIFRQTNKHRWSNASTCWLTITSVVFQ